ncbi:MAG: mercury transporter [Altibacter sp.]|jgi:mercuric ion transport protein|uniref:mercuric transport protein MerTP n=1 Tax=Altibacter sp. TaxID=2024823 RepID=UPI000C97B61F|nr:mercuric transport protein MerTP [Altibacter sp.]MAP53275.1 mercury transporter [Altibacter sp.]|tara:strand:- start:208 stop:819 length:612 start_codon:yes stop_codon:yes gene_type:complete
MAITKLNKKASMGTAVFSAVSLKLCCWGPLLLTSVVGISGSSVYFSWLIALKPYLLAIAFLSLGLAFYQVYKKKKVDDCDNCETDKPSFFKSKFYLWLVTVFVVVMTLVSYYPQIFHPMATKEIVATNNTHIQTVKLNIEGMVCSGCEENINHSVNKINGVTNVTTSFERGTSIIEFDTTKTNVDEIKKVIQSKGYLITNSRD